MPRVYVRRDWAAKDERVGDPDSPEKPRRTCGRCGQEIVPGEPYRSWSFRYGGTHYRCFRSACDPRPSELTQSKMSTILAAIEGVDLSDLNTHDEIEGALEEVATVIEEVAAEYEEAAQPFGGQGENQERSEQLSSWADEVRDALSSITEDCPKCGEHQDSEEDCLACDESEETWINEMREAAGDALAASPL